MILRCALIVTATRVAVECDHDVKEYSLEPPCGVACTCCEYRLTAIRAADVVGHVAHTSGRRYRSRDRGTRWKLYDVGDFWIVFAGSPDLMSHRPSGTGLK